ncbi:hypothetical protein Agub_g14099, partial [Astrephomene gubernaculifera]
MIMIQVADNPWWFWGEGEGEEWTQGGRGAHGGRGTRSCPVGSPSPSSMQAGDDEEGGVEVEEDGWDVVQAPFLPPPPSQPDEVEHWTRAMFTDATTTSAGGSSGSSGSRAHGGT